MKKKLTLDEMAAMARAAGITYGKLQAMETLQILKEQEERKTKNKKVETPSAR